MNFEIESAPIKTRNAPAPDCVRVIRAHGRQIVLLCDGTGSWDKGELAAPVALERLCAKWSGEESPDDSSLETDIRQICSAVGREFAEPGWGDASFSAAAIALLDSGVVNVLHAGTYEVALVRDGSYLNHTHAILWVDLQVRAGILTPDEATSHPLSKVYGGPPAWEPISESPWHVKPGDTILLANSELFDTVSIGDVNACLARNSLGPCLQERGEVLGIRSRAVVSIRASE